MKTKPPLLWITLIIFIFLPLGTGCQQNHLVYVQETSMGLCVGIGTEGTQKVSLGYDRDIYAIVPKKGDVGDAMSLLSINRAEIGGLNDVQISEFVASGIPAENLADDQSAVNTLRSKIYGR